MDAVGNSPDWLQGMVPDTGWWIGIQTCWLHNSSQQTQKTGAFIFLQNNILTLRSSCIELGSSLEGNPRNWLGKGVELDGHSVEGQF